MARHKKKTLKINFHPDTMLTTTHKRERERDRGKKQFTRKVNKPFIKPFSPNRTNIILNDLPERRGWGCCNDDGTQNCFIFIAAQALFS